jgi:hypothetical protein
MSAVQIRKFLLRNPRPASLRMKTADDVQLMTIPPAPHWAEIAESVDALAPELIEMLDVGGKIIRAVRSDSFDETAIDEKTERAKTAAKITFDAETERFNLFAHLIAEAYKHSTEVAFGKMVDLFQSVVSISDSKEKALETLYKMLKHAYEENAELTVEAGEKKDPLLELAGAFMGGQAQAAVDIPLNKPKPAAAPPPAKAAPPSNGKARR